MSNSVVSHLAYNKGEDASSNLMTFCMQLLHHSQWKSVRRMICGSKVEIPIHTEIAQSLGIAAAILDIDEMSYSTFHFAVHRSAWVPITYTGDILRIFTDNVHSGYVRLINEKDNTELLQSDLCTPWDSLIKHGPALLANIETTFSEEKYTLSKVAGDGDDYRGFFVPIRDMVFAIHSPYWPTEATEWIVRRRCRGFPSKSVIKQIVRYGCDFVQVSHNRRYNDNEWRFSFSRAESFIIKSWSISQRIVYTTLWVLNKKIASRNLCSYFFKTLMFWACEKKSTQSWSLDLLLESVCELLIHMMECLKSKFCVNYFIPDNNMMDHLIDTDLSYEIGALSRACQSSQVISEIVDTCERWEFIAANKMYHIESPAWIKRSLVIHQWIHNAYDNFRDLFSTDLSTDLQNALYAELSDIYRGLCFQQKSVGCMNAAVKHIYLLKSECHLLLAINLCESYLRDTIYNCSRVFMQSMLNQFISYDSHLSSNACDNNVKLYTKRTSTAGRRNSFGDRNEEKYLMYSRSQEKPQIKLVSNNCSEMISAGKNVKIVLFDVTEVNTVTVTNTLHLKEWPGHTPTVNISWFLAKAYLANFYYTSQRDVSLIIKTCNDIIDAYRQSEMNLIYAEATFPVILSTQWTGIYDKEIQELLGFYSLCSHAFDLKNRSVYLGVCPIQFSYYLKLRVELVVGNSFFGLTSANNFFEHFEACRGKNEVSKRGLILIKAIQNYFCTMRRRLS